MAMFPRLSELFGTPAPAAPLSPQQQATATTLAQQQGGTPSPQQNPTVPSSTTPQSDGSVGAIPPAGKGDASPLSEYSKIWETKLPIEGTAASLIPTMEADPAKMLAAAKTYDFTKGMDPAMLELAGKGDATALAQLINSAAQAGFAASAQATVSIVKNALGEQAKTFESKYAPNMMRNASINDAVEKSIPLSADPSAAPLVAALTKQLGATFPSATAEQVTAHVEKYLENFAKSVVEGSGGKVQSKADLAPRAGSPLQREEQDWSVFFGTTEGTMQ